MFLPLGSGNVRIPEDSGLPGADLSRASPDRRLTETVVGQGPGRLGPLLSLCGHGLLLALFLRATAIPSSPGNIETRIAVEIASDTVAESTVESLPPPQPERAEKPLEIPRPEEPPPPVELPSPRKPVLPPKPKPRPPALVEPVPVAPPVGTTVPPVASSPPQGETPATADTPAIAAEPIAPPAATAVDDAGADTAGETAKETAEERSRLYARSLWSRILRHKPGGIRFRGTVVLSFALAPDGELVSVAVIRPSGRESLDQAALDAVRAAAPFPPPPDEIPGHRLTFEIAFEFR